jgi:hypothetical protein
LLKVLVGITPETHFTALKLVRLVGFTIMGTIPNFCDLVYEGKRVGAVISYYLPEAVASKRSGLPSEAVFPVSEANDLPSISKGGA